MKRILKLFLIGCVFFAVHSANAQTGQHGVGQKNLAQSTMNFLQVSVVPKASAMGEAYTSLGTGVEAMFYNPAGLAEMEHQTEFFVSTMEWIADINYFAGGAAFRFNSWGTIGANFVVVDYGDMYGTSLLPLAQSQTDPLGYTDNGMIDNIGGYYFGLAYAKDVTDAFKFGGGMRLAGQQLGQSVTIDGDVDNNMTKLIFDLGVKYITPFKGFRFGMSIRNFSNSVRYEQITTQLPLTFNFGGAIDVMNMLGDGENPDNSLLTTVEFSHPNNYTERVHIGVDYSVKQLISLRLGYVTNHDINSTALGFGVFPSWGGTTAELSYTYSKMDVFNDVNRFSLKFAF